jgi:hypothetical protein
MLGALAQTFFISGLLTLVIIPIQAFPDRFPINLALGLGSWHVLHHINTLF